MTIWKRTEQELPEEKVVVRTILPSGEEADLYRIGNLWFEGTTHLYYAPERWAYY